MTHILPIQEQGRLIAGNDLMQTFNLKAGKQIGDLLAQVEERQFNGEIRTREEAFAAVAALIHPIRIRTYLIFPFSSLFWYFRRKFGTNDRANISTPAMPR